MIHKHPGKIVFCLMLLTALALMAVTGSRVDFTAATTPGNPGVGKFRLWANSGSGQLECLNSSGGSCMPSGTPGGSTNDIQFNNAGAFAGGRCTMDSSSNIACNGTMTSGATGTATGAFLVKGTTSGTVTIQPQAVAGTYNFNLPISAGTSGQPLLSAGGGASPMTYGTVSGSGNFCLTTSCVMTTPNLGTPSAATLTNATGLPLSGLATQAADTVVMNATGGTASPTAKAMPTTGTNGCAGASDAISYNTTTHALGCNTISSGGSFVLREQHTASASASLDFTSCISSSYDSYVFKFVGVVLATDNASLGTRFSTDGGSTWISGATAYQWAVLGNSAQGASLTTQSSGDSKIALVINSTTNTLSTPINGTLNFEDPLNSSLKKAVEFHTTSENITPRYYFIVGGGWYTTASAVNAVQFLASTGNLTSGKIYCYGLSNS